MQQPATPEQAAKEPATEDYAMQRTVIILVLVIIAVAFLGYVALPWFKSALGLDSSEIRVNILSAFIDPEVVVPGTKGQTVQRIVAEVEIIFPYGTAPDSIMDLSVRDDEDKVVEVDWGATEPSKIDNEGRSTTKLIVRECFFPTDFKQGKLWSKTKFLYYFKMPPLPFNAPAGK